MKNPCKSVRCSPNNILDRFYAGSLFSCFFWLLRYFDHL